MTDPLAHTSLPEQTAVAGAGASGSLASAMGGRTGPPPAVTVPYGVGESSQGASRRGGERHSMGVVRANVVYCTGSGRTLTVRGKMRRSPGGPS